MILKADDYVRDFMKMYEVELERRIDIQEALVDPVILICRRLIVEFKEIGILRKAQCNEAWDAILKEQDRKWKAIVRRLPNGLDEVVNSDAFINVWEHFKNEVDKNG